MPSHQAAPAALDLDFVRRQFPALATDWALFDNAGGSVPPRQVIERVGDYLGRFGVQLGASYGLSVAAGEAVVAGRRAAAALVGAAPDEVVLNGSTTLNTLLLAQALAPQLGPGDEVVVTNLDHEANIGAWRRLAGGGVVVREWRLRPASASLELADLEELLGERTRLVCFTHCANVVGRLHDARAIVQRVHAAGALAVVDGVAFAPHRRVDVKALDCDFYLLSLYKTYGPHLGLLYGKREQLLAARGLNHYFVGDGEVPAKLQPGGPNHELVASLAGILDYFAAVDCHHSGPAACADATALAARLERVYDLFARHEEELVRPLLDFLGGHPRVRLVGPAGAARAERVPTVAFTVAGRKASEVPPLLDAERLAVRWGDFYARRAIEALGLAEQDGIVRVSLAHYNTQAEVARLIAALDRIL